MARERGAATPGRPTRPGAVPRSGAVSHSARTGAGPDLAVGGPGGKPRTPLAGWLALVLSLVGLGITIYLTCEHYTGNRSLVCSDTGTVNCAKVTTSPQSVVFGVPVAVWGLLFFVAMVVLCAPQLWRSGNPLVHRARLLAVAVGILSVFYLVYVELFEVDAVCLWCTGVHVVTFLLLLVVVTADTGNAAAPGRLSR